MTGRRDAGRGTVPKGPARRPSRSALGRASTLTPKRLLVLSVVLFVALALPSAVLVGLGFRQLDLASFRQQQIIAESFVVQVDGRLAAAIARESSRPAADYVFALADGSATGLVQRSPLASPALPGDLPGLIGYFEVDPDGVLSTPLLPADGATERYGLVDPDDLASRRAVADRLAAVLADNRLVDRKGTAVSDAGDDASKALAPGAETDNAPASAAFSTVAVADADPAAGAGQAAFDRLANRPPAAGARRGGASAEASADEAATDLLSDDASADVPGREAATERFREQAPAEALPQIAAGGALRQEVPASEPDPARESRVSAFDGDVEPLVFSQLDTGHFVLFRNAWRDGRRHVQGMLLDDAAFVAAAVREPFVAAGFADGIGLRVLVMGADPTRASPRPPTGTRTILQTRLSPPLAAITLAFEAAELPPSPVRGLLVWSALSLFTVLAGATYAIYRFGLGQIALTRQQRTFVSAVTHELKTPLTSIRMYGEMLREGWASDEKKREYYDFIHAESERLSRLIDNVLTLARIERGGKPALEVVTVGEALDLIRSKVAAAVAQAGFALTVEAEADVRALPIRIDPDGFAQIFINLIDNALKYSATAARRDVVLSAHRSSDGRAVLRVRDFGPGVGDADMKRLFELFYRPDTSLTRRVAGTGIGLALVRELAIQIDGRVDVVNAAPGAVFSLSLPVAVG